MIPIVIEKDRKPNWFQTNLSIEKLTSDWKKIKENTVINHFINKIKKAYDHIQNFGGLVIYGKSSYNMGGNEIKGNLLFLAMMILDYLVEVELVFQSLIFSLMV